MIKYTKEIDEVKILLPEQTSQKKYRFEKNFVEIINKRKQITKIIRTVTIRFSGIENDKWRFQIVCHSQEIVAEHIGSITILQLRDTIFNEIIIYVNQNGIILSVLNLKQIQELWQTVKNDLRKKHEGQVLENFFYRTNAIVASTESILKYLDSKEMYGLYFNGCWGFHNIQKPRFAELHIIIEKRIQHDMHNQHLQRAYSHDAQLIIKKETETKKQYCELMYSSNNLDEAFLETQEENKNSKYSIVCLTK